VVGHFAATCCDSDLLVMDMKQCVGMLWDSKQVILIITYLMDVPWSSEIAWKQLSPQFWSFGVLFSGKDS